MRDLAIDNMVQKFETIFKFYRELSGLSKQAIEEGKNCGFFFEREFLVGEEMSEVFLRETIFFSKSVRNFEGKPKEIASKF